MRSSRSLTLLLYALRAIYDTDSVDWLVIAAYFALNLAIGLYYARRARGSTTEFFLSGRDVPWWLAGTSMVATTFAADTPLVVTGMVARNGIAGNWLWWNMAASGMLTVFVYARLWRRAGVMTDVEFAELRYAGKPAAFLRGFRALYLGIPINCIVIGWVNLAMMKILEVTLGLDADGALVVAAGHAGVHGVLHDHLGTVGRARHRPRPVRPEDGHGHRARLLRGARRRRPGQCSKQDRARSTQRPAPARGSRSFRRPTRRGCRRSRCSSTLASTGGPAGIPAPSRAAAATSRSESFPRRTNVTGCSRRCGSTSRTTRCARGPGF